MLAELGAEVGFGLFEDGDDVVVDGQGGAPGGEDDGAGGVRAAVVEGVGEGRTC